MCSIHLIVDKKKMLASSQAVEGMMQSATRRGPDAQGFLHWETGSQTLWVAANRLKIIDLSPAADQPMLSADGRYLLVFNGEIYNYHDLRNQLLTAGVTFTTHSDTEVLLQLLMAEGVRALTRLNGMFALAFYDRQEETLLTARDSFGMKPLYYAENEQYVIISSTTQSILASGLIRKELDEQQISHYLRFKYATPSYTFFRHIRSLPPGYCLEKQGNSDSILRSFLSDQAADNPPDLSEDTVVAQTEELLTDAVLRHLAADMPCGLFLSGGVDSTLLLAIMQRQGAHPVPTFSVINEVAEQNFGTRDYHYARQAADRYGTHHYELTLQPALVEEAWTDFLHQTDQPVGDSAALMTYLLSQEARKVAGVVLSGAGADELFGGYHRHQAFQWYLQHYTLLQKTGFIRKAIQHLPTGLAHPWRKQFRLLQKLGQSLTADPMATYQNFVSLPPLPGQYTDDARDWQEPPKDQEAFAAQHLAYALNEDLQRYLPCDVLALSDNMSMAQSLEMRMPYLDKNLADYVRQLPAAFRLKHGRKWILKHMLDRYGGKTFTRRSKEGFGVPSGAWLRNEAYHFLRQPLENADAPLFRYVPFPEVQHLLQAHLRQQADHSQELWMLLILSAWLTHHFD